MRSTTAKSIALLAFSIHFPTTTLSQTTGFPPCDALLLTPSLTPSIIHATHPSYEPLTQSHFDAKGRLHPWCFFQPHTAQELANAISILSSANNTHAGGDWAIAVRSGGHHNPGSNGISNGLTIDLGMLDQASYDAETGLARLGPGARWRDVYRKLLENGNVTVTGGRDGNVGVGGLLTGGGMSFYSGRNGMACDNVVNFEVVLADGTVVNANAEENPRLWRSLKGGGLNFGIVTRFDVEVLPAEDVGYGVAIVSGNYSDRVVDAFAEFTDLEEEEGRNDHLISIFSQEGRGQMNVVNVMVNTKGVLESKSFEGIGEIPALSTTWERTSLADAVEGGQIPGGQTLAQTTLTFLNSAENLRQSVMLHRQLISSLSEKISPDIFATNFIIQPFPSYLSKLGKRNGRSNVLGLDRISGNAILWTAAVMILNGNDATLAVARAELSAMAVKMQDFASKEGGTAEWIYLNYAAPNQNPLGSYGPENVAFMKEVAEQYDQSGFWQRRVPGGFKLSRVAG